ncbi:hypothetical protein Salat_0146400 [Sesamum alatum]|uniref:DUF4283 domain-containing protein n=1 Tax=Sesamum alatum TaxID=300844 RepID=A0AAE2CXH9_9LAMI|nr:hypothetical protein Salat_0146400 [Sesamum alatum]
MDLSRLSTDRFLLSFNHRIDKNRVLEGGPWNFENHLIIFGEIGLDDDPLSVELNFNDFSVCVHGVPITQISVDLAHSIGRLWGMVKDVHLNSSSSTLSSFFKFRVSLDVRKPLLRATKLRTKNAGLLLFRLLMSVRGLFYFFVGLLVIPNSNVNQYVADFVDLGSNTQYGPWLRSEPRSHGSSSLLGFGGFGGACSFVRRSSSLCGQDFLGAFGPSVLLIRILWLP